MLQTAGAEMVVLCTNTMHAVADVIAAAVDIPFLHIADPTAAAIKAAGLTRAGLLGTRYTMERDFYRGRLEQVHDLSVLVPDEPDRTVVHRVIYDELVQGIIRDESRKQYLEVIDRLCRRGADGIIAGCTEIELLVQEDHIRLPYFPTTRLHALAAVDIALTRTWAGHPVLTAAARYCRPRDGAPATPGCGPGTADPLADRSAWSCLCAGFLPVR